MRKTATISAMAAALAIGGFAPAAATDTDTSITGTVGQRVDDDGSYIRMRYVGDPAPDGYGDGYQHGTPNILTPSPEEAPVTISGTLDLDDMVPGTGGIIGLYDAETLRAGGDAHQHDNGMYVGRTTSGYRIGVSDGNAGGGEIVQSFTDVPADEVDGPVTVELTVDGTADPATCASDTADVATADGCLTLLLDGEEVATDSYGTLSDQPVELAGGAHPGWWAFGFDEDQATEGGTYLDYDLTVSPATVQEPRTADDCKKGGYADFDFRNQGQCIKSVKANPRANR